MLIGLQGEDGVVVGETADVDLTDADIARDLSVGDRLVDPEHADGKEEEGDRHQGKKGDAWLQGTAPGVGWSSVRVPGGADKESRVASRESSVVS